MQSWLLADQHHRLPMLCIRCQMGAARVTSLSTAFEIRVLLLHVHAEHVVLVDCDGKFDTLRLLQARMALSDDQECGQPVSSLWPGQPQQRGCRRVSAQSTQLSASTGVTLYNPTAGSLWQHVMLGSGGLSRVSFTLHCSHAHACGGVPALLLPSSCRSCSCAPLALYLQCCQDSIW